MMDGRNSKARKEMGLAVEGWVVLTERSEGGEDLCRCGNVSVCCFPRPASAVACIAVRRISPDRNPPS